MRAVAFDLPGFGEADKPRDFVEVYGDGRRLPSTVTHDGALAFAQAAAKEFEVGKDREVPFDKERAKRDVKGETTDGNAKSKKTRKTEK